MQFLRFDTATRAAAVGGVTTLVDVYSISFIFPQSVFILVDINQFSFCIGHPGGHASQRPAPHHHP